MVKPVFVTTTFTIEGYAITAYRGLVRGIVVRSPTLVQGFLGGLKQIVGGRIGAYTEMCEQAREQAYEQMIQHARALGANAIVGTRYDGSEVQGGTAAATEVLCYGTAVVVEPRPSSSGSSA
ncbi:YbjQ family protein [Aphanothece minutissima]|jgi:uncharacterized protein YbjQ (UPF0145 family)|uniref:UPF0145 protein C7B81_02940 n=1 Tax=Aphanothece cf. minutissima CCALA 015 TaxID=2107695 RepID=A0ABX5F9V6_9CHRO|nr:YbjQ family protein [Aphanothece minutissima]PSB38546.1 hypothetical protein C7B81_02940 [Aphanothece cf. minutissima CCALA 015]